MPYAHRAKEQAEAEGDGDDEDQITAQRDQQGGHALAQSFQRAGGGHGDGGGEKTDADDPQGSAGPG